MSRHGGTLHLKAPRVRQVPACKVNKGHILEWLDMRYRVLGRRIILTLWTDDVEAYPARAVILRVRPIQAGHRDLELYYWADEPVTLFGRSFS
jgi:hypothetical protein